MSFSALDSALLGPLFASAPMRAVFSDENTITAMLRVEAALARAAALSGLAPPELAAAIEAIEPKTLDAVALGNATATAGVPVIPFIAAVRRRLPPELEPHFHAGATTQDIMDTALVLRIRDAARQILTDLDTVLRDLADLARTHRATLCVGRTYGQHAAPTTFGFKVAGWAVNLAEAAEPWVALKSRVLIASLGGPVGTIAAFGDKGPAVADAFAAELGLGSPPIAWHTRRVHQFHLAAWLGGITGALGKMATDVVHLTSTEVGEVAEPHAPGRGGSSSMPHKRNPIACTVILAAATAVKGLVSTMLDAMTAAHERPAGAWHAEWHALPQLFGLLSGALRDARTLAAGLVIDAPRMAANLEITRGLVFADAAANALSVAIGRAAAHVAVERAADRTRRGEATLREALAADATIPESARRAATAAFDPAPAIEAAAAWTDRALASIDATRKALANASGG